MSRTTKEKARKAAERWTPAGAPERDLFVNAFAAGYMAGHAAHTRWANKTIEEYRRAVNGGCSGAK